jgi:hypothetical protein
MGSASATQIVGVYNTGNESLTLTAISIGGSFVVDASNTTCSTSSPVLASASCTIGVVFQPTAAGSATGTLTLTDDALNVSGSVQQVQLTGQGIQLYPILDVSPAQLNFSSILNGASVAPEFLAIQNDGSQTLTWTAANTQPWLALGVASGTAPASVQISVNVAGLAVGTYQDTITVTASGVSGSPVAIPVTLTILAPPVSPSSLAFIASIGGPAPPVHSLSVHPPGSATWTASKTQPWLQLSSVSGTSPATIRVSVNPSGLRAGSYADTITVTIGDPYASTNNIPVSLIVDGPVRNVPAAPCPVFNSASVTGRGASSGTGSNPQHIVCRP